jgi:hypothetical protein
MLTPCCQFGDHGGDILIGSQRLLDRQYIIGKLLAIRLREAMKILRGAEEVIRHSELRRKR